jgi:adenylosuccinate synthase
VLLGLQWGDEGKGKVVDVLTPSYDIIARFQGGPNAGHTLEFDGIKHVLHTIPSGIFHENTLNVVGNGVVIDPVTFQSEIQQLQQLGVDVNSRLLLSRKAHLILPTHRLLDAASEAEKGNDKIGSTLRGIGPAYMDKTGRNGLRIGDIFSPDFDKNYRKLVEKHRRLLGFHNFDYDLKSMEPAWFEGIENIRRLRVIDSEYFLNQALGDGKSILAEGAQGSLLDIDFGSYPFVTSSNTVTAGACTGLGIAPNRIGRVIGIFKAYCTRVGSGPFPTELEGEQEEQLRKAGNEFGSTTGRPRRCGWLDLVALRYAAIINGVTELHMTKADVLGDLNEIPVCTAYNVDGLETKDLPYRLDNVSITPLLETLRGWKQDLGEVVTESAFPQELSQYIAFIERYMKIPVSVVSVGPDRRQTIIRETVHA